MSKYKGKKASATKSAEEVFGVLTDVNQLNQRISELPEERRKMVENVKFDVDYIEITSPMGPIRFEVKERLNPTLIAYTAVGSPIAIDVELHIAPVADEESEVSVVIEAEIPFMLKAMIGGKLQDAADQLSQAIAVAVSR